MLSSRIVGIACRRAFGTRAVLCTKGDAGSGVGHGGGAGGSIREAGGKFGEAEAARENAYFKKLEAEQFEEINRRHNEEIKIHEAEIKRHQEAINVYRARQEELKKSSGK